MSMTIHIHRYVELSAPLAHTQTLLTQQAPLGAVRLGSLWRWLDELWTIERRSFDDGRMLWQGTCPAVPKAAVLASATLHDATIATHLHLHVALDLPEAGRLQWGQQPAIKRRLSHLVDTALVALQAAATEQHTPSAMFAALPTTVGELATALRRTHPATVAAFEAMDALPSLGAVAQLDQRWQATEHGQVVSDSYERSASLPPTLANFDLVYAGGGLGLLHAAVMATRYGCRVLLFDRGEVGCAHREWNISDHELHELVRLGLFTPAELERVVMRRYGDGVVRFAPDQTGVRPAELHMPNVLNVGLDAAGLLQLARRKLEGAGGLVLDHRTFRCVVVRQPGEVVVEVTTEVGVVERYGAHVLIDGMGATSPLALRRFAGQPFAGVCPTVGTVVEGLEQGSRPDQHNPDVGDILVSVTDTQRGRQLIWEGFAGRDDELTVYVFYYDLLHKQGQPSPSRQLRNGSQAQHSLLDLFEDYFRLLPTYKRLGPQFRHIKPVYGFIPARHTQRRLTVPLLTGVLPVGDSSAQQSPLTFCGFGSHVRNLDRTTALLQQALSHNLLAPQHLGQISAYQANVALNWVFSRFMQPWDSPADVNRLQNIFARVLNDVGVDVAVRFFQDQMTWHDYGRIVNHTLAIYKPIIPTALRVLGSRDTRRWITDWLRFSGAAATAALGRGLGERLLDGVERRLTPRYPAAAFSLKARRAEWRAMGWA